MPDTPKAAPPAPTPVAPTPTEVQHLGADAPASAIMDLPVGEFQKALGIPDPKTVSEVEAENAPPAEPEPEAAPAPEASAATTEAETPAEPVQTAPAEAEPSKEPRQYVTKFAVADETGAPVEAIPELTFSFTANGKEYEKVPIDKVVKLAQMGVYQHDREQALASEKAQAQQALKLVEEVKQQLAQYDAYYDRLFTDEAFAERARDIYLTQNSPEQRAARAEAQTRETQAQLAQTREEQQLATFVATQLSPKVERLLQQNPLVSDREVIGQYTLLTAPLLERGRVPVSQLARVQSLVENELAQWTQHLQTTRDLERKKSDSKTAQVQAQATLAKRQVARAAAPKGVAAQPETQKSKKYDSTDAWLKDGMGGVLPVPDADD